MSVLYFIMGTLAKGKGKFSLLDSDNNIGSFFSKEDLAEILEIDNVSGFYEALRRKDLLKEGCVDEGDMYKQFKELKNEFSKIKLKRYVSLDECVLFAIFRRTFPDAEIKQQVIINGKYIDFEITHNGITKYIEFDGPGHFIKGRYDSTLEDLFERVKMVKQVTGCELIRWPYWIQRCSRNAQIIFDTSLKGYGALWTTTKFFNEFSIPNPSETIKRLTRRFNAENKDGIGYFYEASNDVRIKPEHILIKSASKNKDKLKCFLPPDAEDMYYWIPTQLWEDAIKIESQTK